MTAKEQEYIRAGRHRARTDALWLGKHILWMDKFQPHVHGALAKFLQQFDGCQGKDEWFREEGRYIYTPRHHDPKIALPNADKRRLLLAPRGWFKTSINVITHSIQWILNFPDVTILLLHASQEVVEQVLVTVKQAFWKNNVMRYYFPEFCFPQGSKEVGTQTQFDIPCRTHFTVSPTIQVGGIESVRTGMHYHVMKFTDIVDDKNTATKDQCEKIVYKYAMARNLLISPAYWIDIEGTRYDFSDLYGRQIDAWLEEDKQEKPHEYKIFIMPCYKRALENETFSPLELDAPYVIESRFPEEVSTEELVRMQHDPVAGEETFNTQQLNNPVGTEHVAFPLQHLKWISDEALKRIPMQYFITSVDLAETQKKRSDFTCITTCGVDRMNRRYVVDVRLGKFLPDETVDLLFLVQQVYRPLKIKVEETGFARGLYPTIRRKSEMTGIWPNWDFIKRETDISKPERIMGLQPFYKAGLIFFAEHLDEFVKQQLKHQLSRFPKYQHDDILDTIVDQFQNEQVFGPVKPRLTMEEAIVHAQQAWLQGQETSEMIYGKKDNKYGSWTGLGAL